MPKTKATIVCTTCEKEKPKKSRATTRVFPKRKATYKDSLVFYSCVECAIKKAKHWSRKGFYVLSTTKDPNSSYVLHNLDD